VLDDVSLTVQPGEFVALVGPNGSGKSTLLRVLLGVQGATAGSVRLFGQAPDRFHDRWRLGYVPQRPTLESEVPATVAEIVASGRLRQRGWWRRQRDADVAAIGHAIESVGLGDVADRPLNELSIGQQQRAFIARAFASEPTLLVLDEPIAGCSCRTNCRRLPT
jgi:zinc transport system ATP-binding protein